MDKTNVMCYLIMAENDEDTVKFLGIDDNSGGYPYWSSHLSGARFFESEAEARQMLVSEDFTRDSEFSDGTRRPPRMIDMGANLCNVHPQGTVRISIVPILAGAPIVSKTFSVEIENPPEVKRVSRKKLWVFT
jgi:hypothetical protein